MISPVARKVEDPAFINYFLSALNERISLHPKQLEIAKAVDQGSNVMASCGRKLGKSTVAQYVAIRKALLYSDAYIYIVAPFAKQVREIYWEQELVTKLCPPELIKSVDKAGMRFRFVTGSFIKFDGADNTELHRGPAMHMLIADEFKDHDPRLLAAMEPNLLSTKGQFCVFGTPPDEDRSPKARNWFYLVKRAKTDPAWQYFIAKSSDNPHNDPVTLAKTKEALEANGESDVWLREYEGVYVPRESAYIFPMFEARHRQLRHVYPHQDIMEKLRFDQTELEWWCLSDPGTATCFAQLFIGWDKKEGMLFLLAENYVTKQEDASTAKMLAAEREQMLKLNPLLDSWYHVYDEQAAWFYNERVAIGASNKMLPTQKNRWKHQSDDLKPGLSLLKDIMARNLMVVSDQCTNFIQEVKGYRIENSGKIQKRHDHLIDCIRYFLLMSGYTLPTSMLEEEKPQVMKEQEADPFMAPPKSHTPVNVDRMMDSDISEYILSEALEWYDSDDFY